MFLRDPVLPMDNAGCLQKRDMVLLGFATVIGRTDNVLDFSLFDTSKTPDDGRTHIGIRNVRNRIETVCGGELTLESKIGTGTKVAFLIPKPHTQPCAAESLHKIVKTKTIPNDLTFFHYLRKRQRREFPAD